MPTSWVLVADEVCARVLIGFTLGNPIEIARFNRQSQPVGETGGSASQTPEGSMATERTRWNGALDIAHFADEISVFLDEQRRANHLQRLIIVAPKPFLGLLQNCVSQPLNRLVIREIEEDWVGLSESQLAANLKKISAAARPGNSILPQFAA